MQQSLSHRQVVVVFSGLMLGLLLAGLDHTIVATALPTIVGDLGGLDQLSWVVTAYLLATTVSAPLYGKLGDLYGRKRCFQGAIVIFLAGSALCGAAQNMAQLIAFRALQGLGGGGLIVLAQAIVGDVVSPRERGRYQGYLGAVFGVSSVLGPLIGGFFTDHLTWRWAFYVNLPLGAVALAVTGAVLPDAAARLRPRIDAAGAVLLSATVTGFVLVTSWGGNQYAWGSAPVVGVAAATVALAGAFLAVERRASDPVLPLRLFRNRIFAVIAAASFLVGAAMFATFSFLPVFLQVVGGASATTSGLLLVPLMAGLLASSITTGRVISRTGRYRTFPIAGTALSAAGLALFSSMGPGTTLVMAGLYMAFFGIGIGMVMPVLVLVIQNAVEHSELGVATSTAWFLRSVGGSVGVALLGAAFASRLAGSPAGARVGGEGVDLEVMRALPLAEQSEFVDAFAASLVVVFRLALPIMLGAFVLTWFVREIPLRSGSVGVVSPLAEAAGEPEPAANTNVNVNGARSPAGRGGGDGRASAGPSSGRRRRR